MTATTNVMAILIRQGLLVLLTFAAVSLGSAADQNNWSNVQTMRVGETVGVIRDDHKRLLGTFTSATETVVTLSQDGQSVSVPRDQVVRVYRSKGLKRLPRVLIGAGIGLAAGIAVDQTLGRYLRNEGPGDGVTAISIASGVGIGAGLGAASGSGYQTVYQRTTPASNVARP